MSMEAHEWYKYIYKFAIPLHDMPKRGKWVIVMVNMKRWPLASLSKTRVCMYHMHTFVYFVPFFPTLNLKPPPLCTKCIHLLLPRVCHVIHSGSFRYGGGLRYTYLMTHRCLSSKYIY